MNIEEIIENIIDLRQLFITKYKKEPKTIVLGYAIYNTLVIANDMQITTVAKKDRKIFGMNIVVSPIKEGVIYLDENEGAEL